jgi:hypothetical protein
MAKREVGLTIYSKRMNKNQKTVFIAVFQSFISRNILNTGILDQLLINGCRVVLFVPPAKETFYREVYNHSNITIESFDSEKFNNKKENIFKSIALLLISTNVMRFRKIKMLEKGGSHLKFIYQIGFTFLFGKVRWFKNFFRYLDYRYNNPDPFNNYFDKYNPDVVFAPDVFGSGDTLMIKSALKHKVRSVGMVASWDNNTTKGLMRVVPDVLLVQNEIIKEESLNIQHIDKKIIRLTGIAHYDYFMEYKPIPREVFFKNLGISPDKKLILFSPAGDKFISTDWQICEILKQAYENKQIPRDVVTLIRMHPTNPTSLEKFTPNEQFIIETPGVSFKGLSDKRKELDRESLHHLIDTLHHCELVINVVSSLVIDAAVLGKPIITIGFEGWEEKVPFGSSVKRYLSDENMAKLLSAGGTTIVKDAQGLIEQINLYLENPELDKEGRQRIVKEQCWKLDGESKFRVANAIIE